MKFIYIVMWLCLPNFLKSATDIVSIFLQQLEFNFDQIAILGFNINLKKDDAAKVRTKAKHGIIQCYKEFAVHSYS